MSLLNKPIMLIISWFKNLFHKHIMIQDHMMVFTYHRTCEAHCKLCNKKFIGYHDDGLFSEEHSWIYTELKGGNK